MVKKLLKLDLLKELNLLMKYFHNIVKQVFYFIEDSLFKKC